MKKPPFKTVGKAIEIILQTKAEYQMALDLKQLQPLYRDYITVLEDEFYAAESRLKHARSLLDQFDTK